MIQIFNLCAAHKKVRFEFHAIVKGSTSRNWFPALMMHAMLYAWECVPFLKKTRTYHRFRF